MKPWTITCTFLCLLLLGTECLGQTASTADLNALKAEIEALKTDYEKRIQALEMQIQQLQSQSSQTPPTPAPVPPPPAAAGAGQQPSAQVPEGAQGAGGPGGALPVYSNATAASKVFNPDIAVIGDFIGATGSNHVNPDPAMQMHESEVAFQAIVDPYARADFFFSYGEVGVTLEEGYITFPAVPGGLLAKIGKQRAAFGKVNTMHNHVLPWIDRPIVTNDLVNGEDGIDDAGISAARLIPNKWVFLEATGQVYRGDSGDVFQSTKRGDLSYVGHLRGYRDITDNTNIDLGVSYAHGHNASGFSNGFDFGMFRTALYGTDATIRWKPLQRSIYHSFVGRSEVIWSRRQQPGGAQSAQGFYISGDYQFARRWFGGIRIDQSKHADNALLTDTGQSAIITYWPSEFSQIRGQYRRTNYNVAPRSFSLANEFLFQFLFSIGAHGAHPF